MINSSILLGSAVSERRLHAVEATPECRRQKSECSKAGAASEEWVGVWGRPLVNFLAEVTWGQPAGQRYAGGLERDSPGLSLYVGANHADAEDGADFAAVAGLEFHRHLLLTL
jgi:hypothetical protein